MKIKQITFLALLVTGMATGLLQRDVEATGFDNALTPCHQGGTTQGYCNGNWFSFTDSQGTVVVAVVGDKFTSYSAISLNCIWYRTGTDCVGTVYRNTQMSTLVNTTYASGACYPTQ